MAKQPIANWDDRHKHASFWWSTALGIGLLKPAPGTWGSLAAAIAGYFMLNAGLGLYSLVALITGLTLVSIWAINDIEKKSGIHDAGEIVIDEVAGQWVAFIPFYFYAHDIWAYIVAFILFRIFDIWKPWPIGPIDRKISGGFGVMIDDIVAGAFAAVLVTLLLATNLLAI